MHSKYDAFAPVIFCMAELLQSSASKPQLAAMRLFAAYAALAVPNGRTPYVKSKFRLLTYKYDAFVPTICRMAELLQKNVKK